MHIDQVSETLTAEIKAIMQMDPNPHEALYMWIDKLLGIPTDAPLGGYFTEVDAIPAYLNLNTGHISCCPIPMLPRLLSMAEPGRHCLCGAAKYRVEGQELLEVILLKSWPTEMRNGLASEIKAAFAEVRAIRL